MKMFKDSNIIISELWDLMPKLDKLKLEKVKFSSTTKPEISDRIDKILEEIKQRTLFISGSIVKTTEGSMKEIDEAIHLFRDWMLQRTIVRVIGTGRARLAGSIPANRLAHGGARVFIQDDIIPMPHSINGGGIIAVSASGETLSVLNILEEVTRKKGEHIKIVGMAGKNAQKFPKYCDIFIGIDQDIDLPNPLQALADTGEQVINELLDAMVVAAGRLAGFDDTTWRIGHEDIGKTGPYDIDSKSDIELHHTTISL